MMKEQVIFQLDQFLLQFIMFPCRKLSWHNRESNLGAGDTWYCNWEKRVWVLRSQYSL